jgi:hypothetical protein
MLHTRHRAIKPLIREGEMKRTIEELTMTGKELKEKYANGERNFARSNLYGSNLSGSDLSRSNLYGSNLAGSNLYGIKGHPCTSSLWLGLLLGWDGPIVVGKTYRCQECGCGENPSCYTDALITEQIVGWDDNDNMILSVIHAGNNAHPTGWVSPEEMLRCIVKRSHHKKGV